nr:AraC family transcriptional regulator [Desulfobulbus rhabdoformis]
MHPHDKKQIQGVRDLLINNLDTPPSLKELARSAGMSHPKLNRCFKQVYGMTVFQYLRLERLNKAKNMLQKDGYSVTETALEVGYDSVSHFSQAYKRQFGTSPSSSLKVA